MNAHNEIQIEWYYGRNRSIGEIEYWYRLSLIRDPYQGMSTWHPVNEHWTHGPRLSRLHGSKKRKTSCGFSSIISILLRWVSSFFLFEKKSLLLLLFFRKHPFESDSYLLNLPDFTAVLLENKNSIHFFLFKSSTEWGNTTKVTQ